MATVRVRFEADEAVGPFPVETGGGLTRRARARLQPGEPNAE